MRKKYQVLFLMMILAKVTLIPVVLSEEPAKPDQITPQVLEKALQKAIRNVEEDKLKKEKEITAELKTKLNLSIQEWIAQAAKIKSKELNQRIEPTWQNYSESKPSLYFDYYLRDLNYTISKSDIIKTDSLVTPYRGRVTFEEKLYIEEYHTPSPSYLDEYLYTLTRPVMVNFEYLQDKFVAVDREYAESRLIHGWPEKIKRERPVIR